MARAGPSCFPARAAGVASDAAPQITVPLAEASQPRAPAWLGIGFRAEAGDPGCGLGRRRRGTPSDRSFVGAGWRVSLREGEAWLVTRIDWAAARRRFGASPKSSASSR